MAKRTFYLDKEADDVFLKLPNRKASKIISKLLVDYDKNPESASKEVPKALVKEVIN